MNQSVLFEKDNGVALITLNRPERRNALNRELLAGIYDRIDECAASSDVRAIVITGAGPSFCAGLDLKAVGTEDLMDPRGDGRDLPDVFGACGKTIIGAVNGHAITGGFELALNCDFLIASEDASFTDTHVKVGIHPGWGMTQLLQQAVGRRMAKQMSLTCRPLPAAEALRAGLVNEVVPAGRLVPRAREIAGEIAAHEPGMIGTVKGMIESRDRATMEGALAHERRGFVNFFEKNWKR